ncbi:Bifunctional solanapyrone synthase [Colletotrichum trifolii]|uniref:Bifunctional solanapyrone synthase n=1 Tax=Colletotrichum trifolii TaxID=5466 RepID=A0A4R8QE99_COLTR|nr:Bifunctional solanapyrone synthase [Colletotrichum trifolii]
MPAARSLLFVALAVGRALSTSEYDSAKSNLVIEGAEFDIAEALLEHGIDISQMPDLKALSETSEPACEAACSSLKLVFGDSAVDTRDEEEFASFISSYWSSNQADVTPSCVVKPSKAVEVSVIVLFSRLTQCPFAAKSGGHASMARASNSDGGITISFSNMKAMSLSDERDIAYVQPGNIWGDVYAELAQFDLTVIGGRLHNIGVGGLTTGGGISFFSNLYGWACDNVESFDVVIASGAIVHATASNHTDLYWALRGGGNNFGLVVSFNLWTVPLHGGEMWGGSRTYTEDKFPEVTDAFTKTVADTSDLKAGLWHVWIPYGGNNLAITTMYYSEPGGGNATIWSDYNRIEAVRDDTKDRALPDWTKEGMEASPPGLREMYYVITTKADPELFAFARDLFFKNELEVANVPGIVPAMVTQGVTPSQLERMTRNGGNPLGLNIEDGPVYIILLCTMWNNKEDDDAIYSFMSNTLEQISTEAKKRDSANEYLYMNYASQFQDVISGYGGENKARLKSISEKYDPKQVFQKLQPGYFKLDRAPIPDSGYFSTSI